MSGLALNISCVAIGGRGLVITGEPGSGKSSLALALIDRGAMLIGDDGVLLENRKGILHAAPPHDHTGLIEIRGVGLVTLPTISAPCALAITLSPDAPRLPEAAGSIVFAGLNLPQITLYPDAGTLPLRAEFALKRYGIA